MKDPQTLQQAILYFADYENCRQFMTALRWPDGSVRCPGCDSNHVVYLEKARVWKCYGKHEKAKFSLKIGTIFEDSPLGLDKWLVAVWMVVNCKNGISSYEVSRGLGVTQKSAWFMLQRIRLALQEGSIVKLGGPGSEVEVDETYIGGKARNMHAGKRKVQGSGMVGKVAVMGLLERHGPDGHSFVRTKIVRNTRKRHLLAQVRKNIKPGTEVFTDALPSYTQLKDDYLHKVIDHAEAYAQGNIHTNGLENFWSLLKRSIKGTYVSVEPFHLFRYLDEQTFRYNNRRDMDDFDRFRLATSSIIGKRLTYAEVTGKQADTQTCIN